MELKAVASEDRIIMAGGAESCIGKSNSSCHSRDKFSESSSSSSKQRKKGCRHRGRVLSTDD